MVHGLTWKHIIDIDGCDVVANYKGLVGAILFHLSHVCVEVRLVVALKDTFDMHSSAISPKSENY